MSNTEHLPGNSDYEDSESFSEEERTWDSHPHLEPIRSALLAIARESHTQNILTYLNNHADEIESKEHEQLLKIVRAELGVIDWPHPGDRIA